VELRQLRSFVRAVEVGSISRAAADLGLVQSAVSQHIAQLEGELATRLLHRSPHGIAATEAGVAFFREAQLILRRLQQATREAQAARLKGSVSVGFSPTTAAVIGMPFLLEMRARYPQVMVHLVESLSGYLSEMLNSRQLDMAILFRERIDARRNRRWQLESILDEDLFYIVSRQSRPEPLSKTILLTEIAEYPLILPSGPHGFRTTLNLLFEQAQFNPTITVEIDSLNLLVDALLLGLGGTIQPWAFLTRIPDAQTHLQWARISEKGFARHSLICSLSDEELTPAGLAARVVLRHCCRTLISEGKWIGAHLHTDS